MRLDGEQKAQELQDTQRRSMWMPLAIAFDSRSIESPSGDVRARQSQNPPHLNSSTILKTLWMAQHDLGQCLPHISPLLLSEGTFLPVRSKFTCADLFKMEYYRQVTTQRPPLDPHTNLAAWRWQVPQCCQATSLSLISRLRLHVHKRQS